MEYDRFDVSENIGTKKIGGECIIRRHWCFLGINFKLECANCHDMT